jgi:hypothetical protein
MKQLKDAVAVARALGGDTRYYGDGTTIHSSGYLDIEVFEGKVVAVWFRCQLLPFEQTEVDGERAATMQIMALPEICGFELRNGGAKICGFEPPGPSLKGRSGNAGAR